MRLMAAAIAIAAASAVFAASAADAQTRKRSKSQAVSGPQTVFVSRDESGRTRTRIIVQRRSYLDGGTEVLPGQRKYSDYHTQPFWSPTDVLGTRGGDRQPLNSRWESNGVRMSW
ncbi:MAG: hypothetical protein FJX62_06865 [Alphaproteobacteria bacterium]|nr:hypothetical protein [Alphaproteobacteria bacterium]